MKLTKVVKFNLELNEREVELLKFFIGKISDNDIKLILDDRLLNGEKVNGKVDELLMNLYNNLSS